MYNTFNIIIKIYVFIYFILCLGLVYLLLINPALAKTITVNNLKVTKVIDGDTIWIKDINNKYFKIRFLGINAPEICTTPPEPYSLESTKYVEYLLNNQTITIKYETSNKVDKYNRILAHVYRESDNLWINLELIQLGLAYVYVIHQNILYLEDLIQAENIAIDKKLNIWDHPKYLPINAEKAINFVNEYKLVIGKIANIISTKNNLWLRVEGSQFKNYTLSKNPTSNLLKCDKLLHSNKTSLTIKINKFSGFFQNNWDKYIGKTVKIRGYIEQFNKNYAPFINLKNLNTIEIL